jgi:hypothetical protein
MDNNHRSAMGFIMTAGCLLLVIITLAGGPLVLQPSSRALSRETSMRLGPRKVINGVSNITPEQESFARNAARDTVLKRARGREAAVFAVAGAIAFGVSASSRRQV